jgi:hypothetical protein
MLIPEHRHEHQRAHALALPVNTGRATGLSASPVRFLRFDLVVCRQLGGGSSVDFAIHKLDGAAWHYSGYGMLIDKLRVPVAAQQNAEIIKPRNDPL